MDLAANAKHALEEAGSVSEEGFLPSAEFEATFTKDEKALLGMRLKQLLDLARAACCQKQAGYKNVELIRYTTKSIDDRLLVLY
jgi:hypothetical protein